MTTTIQELDAHVTYAQQLEQTTGPVVLMNVFSVDPGDAEAFLEIWREAAVFMRRQPGFISSQLHRGTAGSGAFVNVAVWESAAALAEAARTPEFRSFATRFPEGTVARPHLFQNVAVPGVCLA
jgi:quinol monooxygenase YgiN